MRINGLKGILPNGSMVWTRNARPVGLAILFFAALQMAPTDAATKPGSTSELIAAGQPAGQPELPKTSKPSLSQPGAKPIIPGPPPLPTQPRTTLDTEEEKTSESKNGADESKSLEPVQPIRVLPPEKPPGASGTKVGSAAIFTESGPALSVTQSLNEALKNGPRAAAIRAQLGVTRAVLATAATGYNPVFFFDRGLVAEDVNRMGPTQTNDAPWKLFFRLLSAKRLVAQTRIDLLTQMWTLRADVRRAYVELVVALASQRTLEQLRDLSARLLFVTQRRFEAGAVPELDVFRAHLAASQAAVDVGVGTKRIARAKQQLNILMGRPLDTEIRLPDLPDYTSDEPREELRAQPSDILPDFKRGVAPLKAFVAMAEQSRLELKSLGLQQRLNQANREQTLATIVPNPSLSMGKSTAGNPPFGPRLTAVFMTLNQELPMTNLQQGNYYLYKATGTQLRYQVAAEENQVLSDVSGAYNNMIAARDKIRVYQDRLLGESNRMAYLARRSYEAGQSGINSTLQAQQANVQTRSDYLDAVSTYASAFTDLEVAVGRPIH